MAMQLSTMQSVPYLETLKRKGIKNDHTRRYESGMYSSGAVLYRVEPTGEHSMRMITTEQMLEAYAVGEQIKELKKQASAEKGDGKETADRQDRDAGATDQLRGGWRRAAGRFADGIRRDATVRREEEQVPKPVG